MDKMPVTIYLGHDCPQAGTGGWSYIIVGKVDDEERERTLTGSDFNTTSARMMLTAATMALRSLKRPCDVTLVTASPLFIIGYNDIVARIQDASNADAGLWGELYKEAQRHTVAVVEGLSLTNQERISRAHDMAEHARVQHRDEWEKYLWFSNQKLVVVFMRYRRPANICIRIETQGGELVALATSNPGFKLPAGHVVLADDADHPGLNMALREHNILEVTDTKIPDGDKLVLLSKLLVKPEV